MSLQSTALCTLIAFGDIGGAEEREVQSVEGSWNGLAVEVTCAKASNLNVPSS